MNIDSFISNIGASGVAFSSDYQVIITKSVSSLSQAIEMSMRCDSVDMPGRDVETVKTEYYGSPHNIAKTSSTGQVSMSVILSNDLREKEFFEDWIDKMVGNYRKGTPNSNMFALKFLDNYRGTVIINKYAEDGSVVKTVKLIDAFPVTVGNLPLNWQNVEILRLPVTFSYRYYTE